MEARNNLNVYYASVSKAPSSKFIQRKDAETEFVDVAVQTEDKPVVEKAQSKSSQSKSNQNTSTASSQPTKNSNSVQLQSKAPNSPKERRNKSPSMVISDRLPKGSNGHIKHYNRYDCRHDDMEAGDSYAESNTNRQGRIIKINNKR